MTLRLLRGRVVVREIEPKKLGRLFVPDDYYDKHRRETRSHRGTVLAMGPCARTPLGADVPHGFSVGDVVHYVFALSGCEQYRTFEELYGGPCVVIAQEEVIAVES